MRVVTHVGAVQRGGDARARGAKARAFLQMERAEAPPKETAWDALIKATSAALSDLNKSQPPKKRRRTRTNTGLKGCIPPERRSTRPRNGVCRLAPMVTHGTRSYKRADTTVEVIDGITFFESRAPEVARQPVLVLD